MAFPTPRKASRPGDQQQRHGPRRHRAGRFIFVASAVYTLFLISQAFSGFFSLSLPKAERVPFYSPSVLSRCQNLNIKPAPPSDFYERTESDRYVPGTKPVMIYNARIWTGDDDGKEAFNGVVFLDKGIIRWIWKDPFPFSNAEAYAAENDLDYFDANGLWLTPGCGHLMIHYY